MSIVALAWAAFGIYVVATLPRLLVATAVLRALPAESEADRVAAAEAERSWAWIELAAAYLADVRPWLTDAERQKFDAMVREAAP